MFCHFRTTSKTFSFDDLSAFDEFVTAQKPLVSKPWIGKDISQ